MPEELRMLPKKPALKDVVVWVFCILWFLSLIGCALHKHYPLGWRAFVEKTQAEVEAKNGGREFALESSASAFRSVFMLFKSTDGSELYVVAFAEKAPFVGLYSEKIFAEEANSGGFSGLGELVQNGRLSLAEETVRSSFNGLAWIFICFVCLIASIASFIIVLTRYGMNRNNKSEDA